MRATLISFMRETQEISVKLAGLKIQEREKWRMAHNPEKLIEDSQTLEGVAVLHRWKMGAWRDVSKQQSRSRVLFPES